MACFHFIIFWGCKDSCKGSLLSNVSTTDLLPAVISAFVNILVCWIESSPSFSSFSTCNWRLQLIRKYFDFSDSILRQYENSYLAVVCYDNCYHDNAQLDVCKLNINYSFHKYVYVLSVYGMYSDITFMTKYQVHSKGL